MWHKERKLKIYLNNRLKMVKAILSEKEKAFIAAVQAAAGNITPKETGAKKRKKAKQYLTPSPVDNNSDLHHPLPGKAEVHQH